MKYITLIITLFFSIFLLTSCQKSNEEEHITLYFDIKTFEFSSYDENTKTKVFTTETGETLQVKNLSDDSATSLSINVIYGSDLYNVVGNLEGYTVRYPNGTIMMCQSLGCGGNQFNLEYFNSTNFRQVLALYLEPETENIENSDPLTAIGTILFLTMGILLIVLGVISIASPQILWKFEYFFKKWLYKSLEPSDAYYTLARIGGIFSIILGFVFIFIILSIIF